jgi:hypothetical protein
MRRLNEAGALTLAGMVLVLAAVALWFCAQ